jgi:hypothetical protein
VRPTPTPDGDATRVFIPGDRVQRASERFDRELAYAEKAQDHVWMAMAAFSITDRAAKAIATGDPSFTPSLDHETVRVVTIGCYRCEQALDARLVGRRCPGEPT